MILEVTLSQYSIEFNITTNNQIRVQIQQFETPEKCAKYVQK